MREGWWMAAFGTRLTGVERSVTSCGLGHQPCFRSHRPHSVPAWASPSRGQGRQKRSARENASHGRRPQATTRPVAAARHGDWRRYKTSRMAAGPPPM